MHTNIAKWSYSVGKLHTTKQIGVLHLPVCDSVQHRLLPETKEKTKVDLAHYFTKRIYLGNVERIFNSLPVQVLQSRALGMYFYRLHYYQRQRLQEKHKL